MTHTRAVQVPFDFLAAEVAAAPLSEGAMSCGLTELQPDFHQNSPTATLWRITEVDLLRRFRGFSVDEVMSYRDVVWFPGARDPKPHENRAAMVPLDKYLRRLARQLLEADGAAIRPKVPQWGYPSPVRTGGAGPAARSARRTWRWMTFALPWDLLAAALPGRVPAAPQVTWLSAPMAQWLRDLEFAEVHCHLGATADFGAMWVWALRTTSERTGRASMFRSPGAEREEGASLATFVVVSAIVRLLLADFLRLRKESAPDLTFQRYLAGESGSGRSLLAGSSDQAVLRSAIHAFCLGDPTVRDHAELAAAYRDLAGQLGDTFVEPWARWAERGESADPMTPLLRAFSDTGGCSAEMRWTRAGLHYIGYGLLGRADLSGPEQRPADGLFARAFWQAVRGRVALYRHLVQRPMTPGLQWFIRTFARIGPARRGVTRTVLTRMALERAGAGKGLKSFEVRIAPEDRLDQMREVVEQVWRGFGGRTEQDAKLDTNCDHARKKAAIPAVSECGIVIHFTKRRGGGMDQGRPAAHGLQTEADPDRNLHQYRFGGYFQAQSRQARVVAAMFRRWPSTLNIVCGLDVCTDEAGIPTWVIAPLFRTVRRAAAEVAAEASRVGRELPSLRATAHAGEDFVHLLTGLRRIDEALVHLCNREGDRIGHAVALGIAAERWAERTRHVMMTREERLLDLVWEWQFYDEAWAQPVADRGRRIEEEIQKLAMELFRPRRHLVVREVRAILAGLCNPRELFDVTGFPGDRWRPAAASRRDPEWESRVHRLAYLTSPALFKRGTVLIGVDVAEEASALDVLQRALRRKVALQGIAVEINPTSNLLIGDLSDLANHPLWRLRPPTNAPEGPAIDVCIGSDDPLTFATTLRDEYQLVLDTLESSGVTTHDARTWLEDARKAGLVYRFTRREWADDPFENGFAAPW